MGSKVTVDQVRTVLRKQAGLFVRAHLYGSAARGTNDEHSDVDLILVRRTDRSFFDRIREVMPIIRELPRVQILVYTEEELSELTTERNNYFLQKVLSEGIRIEGKQERSKKMAAPG